MTADVLALIGDTVLLAGQCVRLLRVRKNSPDGSFREAGDEAARILARCRDAVACDDPRQAQAMIDESTVELLNVISRVPHELAFFVIEYHASCLAAVRYRGTV